MHVIGKKSMLMSILITLYIYIYIVRC